MFRFASTQTYSYIFLILLLLVLIYGVRVVYSRYLVNKNFSARLIQYYFKHLGWTAFGLRKFLFFVLGVVLAVFSLMQPQWGKKKLSQTSEGIEIVFVLDISMSMAAEDIKPSRLQLSKVQLSKIFEKLQGHRMGLIAFAGQVGVVSPLTQDIGALNLFLDSLDFETISEQGTNIKDALAEAKDLLTRGGEQDMSKTASQVVVLVTDGEDHSSDSLAEAKSLHQEGIRTFVIGVGSKDGARIPVKDSFGQIVGHLKDRKGTVVVTKPDFKFLKSLAKAGSGSFYTLGFGSRLIDQLHEDLSGMKTASFEAQVFDVQDEYFMYPLFLSIFSFFLSFISPYTGRAPKLRSLKHIEDMN